MNPYLMPLEERKDREFRAFARRAVICISLGLALAYFLVQTRWGF